MLDSSCRSGSACEGQSDAKRFNAATGCHAKQGTLVSPLSSPLRDLADSAVMLEKASECVGHVPDGRTGDSLLILEPLDVLSVALFGTLCSTFLCLSLSVELDFAEVLRVAVVEESLKIHSLHACIPHGHHGRCRTA